MEQLFTVDVSGARAAAVGSAGFADEELADLVPLGRQVHDDLLLARARGQVGFGDLYLLGREAMRARDAAEALAARFEDVVILALGAEADVVRSVLEPLAHPFHNLLPRAGRAGRPRVIVVDSTDPDWLCAFLEAFAVEQALLTCVSASGTDLGPLLHFGIVRDMLRKRVGPGYQDHLIVVTDPRGGTLREEALREGLLSFEVPANVPPRFSALTPVALFPAAVAGVDVRGVLGGAHAAAESAAGEDLRSNPAYLLAAVLRVLTTAHGRTHHVFAACGEGLSAAARQIAHLFQETVGAAPDGAGPTCTSISLPREQDALVERCINGRRDSVVVLLEVGRPARDRHFPAGAPGLDWIGDRQLSLVASGNLRGTRRVLREAGVPVVSLRLPTLGPNTVGALHLAAMLSASFGAGLGGVDLRRPPAARVRARAAESEIRSPAE